VVTVTGAHNARVSLAALIAVKPGHRPRLIYRVHRRRPRGKDRRKGFTEADYARLLDDAHQQLGGPLVVIWDNLNTHISAAMTELIAARNWLTVYRLPPYAHGLNPVELVWSHLKRSLANRRKHDLPLDLPLTLILNPEELPPWNFHGNCRPGTGSAAPSVDSRKRRATRRRTGQA
jgi:transposase